MCVKSKVFLAVLSSVMVLISSNIYAAIDGFYTGVQLGQSRIDANATNLKVKDLPYLNNGNEFLSQGPSKTKVDNDGFAGRAYAGYQFNKYISIEGGYTQYADTKITNIYGMTGVDETLHQGAVDTVIKLMLPITQRLHVYAKGGGAYVFGQQIDDATGTVNSNDPSQLTSVSYQKEDIDALRPTYGLGIGFDFTKHFSSDLTWSHIAGGHDIEQSDLITLGVSYHFSKTEMAA